MFLAVDFIFYCLAVSHIILTIDFSYQSRYKVISKSCFGGGLPL